MFSLLLSAHQSCIHITSKEMESKSKCIIEFTLHTWMKYLFFESSWKMQLRCVRGYVILCVAVSTVAWYQDALQTFRGMRWSRTTCCQSFSLTLTSAFAFMKDPFWHTVNQTQNLLQTFYFQIRKHYLSHLNSQWTELRLAPYKLFKNAVLSFSSYIYLICSSAIDLSFRCNLVRDNELNLHRFFKTLQHRYRCFMISWPA